MTNFPLVELILLVLALAVIALVVSRLRLHLVPATANDWFVVFDVDAAEKVLTLSFFPIIAFQTWNKNIYPVTSRAAHTKLLSTSRPAIKVNDSLQGVSISYGRWLRDGALLDANGHADYGDTSDFAGTVRSYLVGGFRLRLATSVPVFYISQIQNAIERKEREAS